MTRIHVSGSTHGCGGDPSLCASDGFPLPRQDNGRERRWDPYKPEGSQFATLNSAMRWIEANIVDPNGPFHQSCDARFATLPLRMGFSDQWRTANIWISYNPDTNPNTFGVRAPGTLDITISEAAFRRGLRQVIGTIIHEIAHINGAGSGQEAENTLPHCGCNDVYDRTIVGSLRLPRFSLNRTA